MNLKAGFARNPKEVRIRETVVRIIPKTKNRTVEKYLS
jgi:hypothetical protein